MNTKILTGPKIEWLDYDGEYGFWHCDAENAYVARAESVRESLKHIQSKLYGMNEKTALSDVIELAYYIESVIK